MGKVPVKELIGPQRTCSACKRMGRERSWPGASTPANWCCSVPCAEQVMATAGWTSIGWLKT